MELTNSKRLIYKSTYVCTKLTPKEKAKVEEAGGGAFHKAFILRTIGLNREGIDQLRARLQHQGIDSPNDYRSRLLAIAEKLARSPSMSSMELAGQLVSIPYSDLMEFTKEVQSVQLLPGMFPWLVDLIDQQLQISPIGRLHLERLEMYSAGIERGELVFTVPMAAGETVSISHKEWSTSTKSFEDITQDFLETYSERGVAETADVSMSTERQSNNATALNFGATTSGTYFGVTVSTTVGLTSSKNETTSAKQSTQQTREFTEKASAKVRKEHKVSVRIENATGSTDTTAKTLTNASGNPIRVDYFRMMRKWRSDLLRYGIRLTYDIAIPLPGIRIWALHRRLASMDEKLRAPYVFGLNAADLNDDNWEQKAKEFGVPPEVVPRPPALRQKIVLTPEPLPWLKSSDAQADRFGKIEFVIPNGYKLESALATATYSAAANLIAHFTWHNGGNKEVPNTTVVTGTLSHFINVPNPPLSGTLATTYSYSGIHTAGLRLELTFVRMEEAEFTWKRDAWAAMKASHAARDAELRAIRRQERDTLWQLLYGKDTLRLRRLEREELVRLVTQWLVGPNLPVVASPGNAWPYVPPSQTTLDALLEKELSFQNSETEPSSPTYNATFEDISEAGWYGAVLFGEFVKFVHQAIEWENLLYFMYPYFWGSEVVGRDKMFFEHPDPEHERFLRAGYVRVVIPIRPGFETDFAEMMERGSLGKYSTHPYISVAEDTANFARTNYAGISPANPEQHARPLLFPEQRATWDTMQAVMEKLDNYKTMNEKYPEKLSDLPSTTTQELADFWGRPLIYKMPGLGADYDLVSLGEDGVVGGEGLKADISSSAGASLIATWFEYTPSSALDIETNTAQEKIA